VCFNALMSYNSVHTKTEHLLVNYHKLLIMNAQNEQHIAFMSSTQNSLFMMKALEFLNKKKYKKMNEEEKRTGGR